MLYTYTPLRTVYFGGICTNIKTCISKKSYLIYFQGKGDMCTYWLTGRNEWSTSSEEHTGLEPATHSSSPQSLNQISTEEQKDILKLEDEKPFDLIQALPKVGENKET